MGGVDPPVETPDEKDDEPVGDGGGGVGGRVEFQQDADEDPDGGHYCEAGEKGLAAAETVDCVQCGERHDGAFVSMSAPDILCYGFDWMLPNVVLPAFNRI